MKKLVFLFSLFILHFSFATAQPLRIVVAGTVHGHVGEVYAAERRGEVEIVGVVEGDSYEELGELLDRTRPEAVMGYGSVFSHLEIVEIAAPRGIDVMVEKPLAVNGAHAARMAELAAEHDIHLLTNYETTWYPTVHRVKELVDSGELGVIRRINVFDGHQGPVEIGCGEEFLAWLTDPVLNGGGAVVDFGCYGANLATWLMGGQRPTNVKSVLQQQKPDIYPRVDDDATIILEYPGATVQIMASWNWPMNRKDMHVYGQNGYVYQDTRSEMRVNGAPVKLVERSAPYDNPFNYLRAVVRGEIAVEPNDLSSLENNLTVVDILDAARW